MIEDTSSTNHNSTFVPRFSLLPRDIDFCQKVQGFVPWYPFFRIPRNKTLTCDMAHLSFFVPMPLFCTRFLALCCLCLGLSAVCFTLVLTAESTCLVHILILQTQYEANYAHNDFFISTHLTLLIPNLFTWIHIFSKVINSDIFPSFMWNIYFITVPNYCLLTKNHRYSWFLL